jgi:hypothetical protein
MPVISPFAMRCFQLPCCAITSRREWCTSECGCPLQYFPQPLSLISSTLPQLFPHFVAHSSNLPRVLPDVSPTTSGLSMCNAAQRPHPDVPPRSIANDNSERSFVHPPQFQPRFFPSLLFIQSECPGGSSSRQKVNAIPNPSPNLPTLL